jgi:hypothetical protein
MAALISSQTNAEFARHELDIADVNPAFTITAQYHRTATIRQMTIRSGSQLLSRILIHDHAPYLIVDEHADGSSAVGTLSLGAPRDWHPVSP